MSYETLQFIAPRVITVNGKPAPCECTDTTVCAYCTQANLILWKKKEEDKQSDAPDQMIKAIRKRGIRTVSRLLGIDHKAITYWLKNKRIPDTYRQKLHDMWGIRDDTLRG